MKYIVKLLIILGIMTTISNATVTQNNSWAINAINHEKVLTQQILKEYAFFGMKNTYQNSKVNLKEYILIFDKELAELITYFKSNKDATKTLNEIKDIWVPIKKVFEGEPKKSEVEALQKKTDKILSKMSSLMKIILKKSELKRDNIVNISSYQAVIVERMAALYMMKTWGIDDPKFNFKMRESITFFNNSLNKMLNSKLTTPDIKVIVKKIMRTFRFFEIMNRSKRKFIPTLIYSKTTKIHKNIDKITASYTKEEK